MKMFDSPVVREATLKKSIAIDLDGTLAHFDGWKGIHDIGDPIPNVLAKLKEKRAEGYAIKIFTARCSDLRAKFFIKRWLEKHDIPYDDITNIKDSSMKEIWDDLAKPLVRNEGFIK